MGDAVWYLRRAVPWTALLGCLGVGAAAVALVHRWDSFASVGLPLVFVVAASAAALVFDEPALAATMVTPRGGRWARASRSLVVVLPPAVVLGMLVTLPDAVRPDWRDAALVLAALASAVLLAALVAWRRSVGRPGGTIAMAVVLLGLTPLVLGLFLSLDSLYPLPDLTVTVRGLWVAVLVGSCGAAGLLISGTTVKRYMAKLLRPVPP